MSKIDRSIEKINYVKLLIFFAIFITITLVLLFTLIVPNVKQYRSSRNDYNRANVYKARVEHVLAGREKELKNLQVKNRKIFDAFKHQFSKEEFVSFANQFFHHVTLKEVQQSDYKKEFKVYELNVTSSLNTPVKFYKFLEGLNRYQNIVQADFPIELNAKDNVIDASFKIKVYKIAPPKQ
ncbi:hypothetical protein [Sulfurospirillum sp. 1612]|uniref:hypothetical protein n=1 Tax=Sulfurospirillum sp. 1612 TaxID=3094835 RepID=UPI002F94DBA3